VNAVAFYGLNTVVVYHITLHEPLSDMPFRDITRPEIGRTLLQRASLVYMYNLVWGDFITLRVLDAVRWRAVGRAGGRKGGVERHGKISVSCSSGLRLERG